MKVTLIFSCHVVVAFIYCCTMKVIGQCCMCANSFFFWFLATGFAGGGGALVGKRRSAELRNGNM